MCRILHSAFGGSPDSDEDNLQTVALSPPQNIRALSDKTEEQSQWPVS
jgi:hypothetical protein